VSLPVTIALVDESKTLSVYDLAVAAGALDEQVKSDFRPVWGGPPATVAAYPKAPPHTWKVILRRDIGEPGALGYHSDSQQQPYALVDVDAGSWSVTASHEILEMLADPWGNRLHAARLPDGLEYQHEQFGLPKVNSRVHYLLEVADPPEAANYEIGTVQVSDFLTPAWYRSSPKAGVAYSHLGTCAMPRQIAAGGYTSFQVAETGHWWQVFNVDGELQLSDLGTFDRAKFANLREFADHGAREYRA
jgi:hypothetical protein